jgi:hypothetical protein
MHCPVGPSQNSKSISFKEVCSKKVKLLEVLLNISGLCSLPHQWISQYIQMKAFFEIMMINCSL